MEGVYGCLLLHSKAVAEDGGVDLRVHKNCVIIRKLEACLVPVRVVMRTHCDTLSLPVSCRLEIFSASATYSHSCLHY